MDIFSNGKMRDWSNHGRDYILDDMGLRPFNQTKFQQETSGHRGGPGLTTAHLVDPHVDSTLHTTLRGRVMCAGTTSVSAGAAV